MRFLIGLTLVAAAMACVHKNEKYKDGDTWVCEPLNYSSSNRPVPSLEHDINHRETSEGFRETGPYHSTSSHWNWDHRPKGKIVRITTSLWLGTARGRTTKTICLYQVVRSTFVMKCRIEANGSWSTKIVGCRTAGGVVVAPGEVIKEGDTVGVSVDLPLCAKRIVCTTSRLSQRNARVWFDHVLYSMPAKRGGVTWDALSLVLELYHGWHNGLQGTLRFNRFRNCMASKTCVYLSH